MDLLGFARKIVSKQLLTDDFNTGKDCDILPAEAAPNHFSMQLSVELLPLFEGDMATARCGA